MEETRTSHTAITVVRYVIGVGSVLGFAWSMWFGIWLFHDEFADLWFFSRSRTEVSLGLSVVITRLLGYLLVADFCLRRWSIVEPREGVEGCRNVLGLVLGVAAVGSLTATIAFRSPIIGQLPTEAFWSPGVGRIADDVISDVGFWMLWGFLLASGIRKLRRMKRAANAE